MSNRVEDLENQVAELQATVDGLTEELVEAKERIHQLEETADSLEASESAEPTTRHTESPPQSTAEQQAEARGTDERRDAQIVENEEPADETPETAEAATPEPADAEAEEADDDDDDDGIIVA